MVGSVDAERYRTGILCKCALCSEIGGHAHFNEVSIIRQYLREAHPDTHITVNDTVPPTLGK
jgi:hypothetical protein